MSYRPATHVLTVELQADPTAIGCRAHPGFEHDFFKQERTNHRIAPPGPFQDLGKGGQSFIIWNGLPVLDSGELPGAEWTAGLDSGP